MVFGRGGEELEALAAAGLRFQVVPGVSAAEGCAAYAGIPLTLRGVSQAVVLATGHTQDDRAQLTEFRPGQTLALYMGVAQYAEIAAALMQQGHDPETPVAVVENGTTDRQRVVRTLLGSLGEAQSALDIRPPALLIVGETTRFAERYSWFEPGKLERIRGRHGAHAGSCKLLIAAREKAPHDLRQHPRHDRQHAGREAAPDCADARDDLREDRGVQSGRLGEGPARLAIIDDAERRGAIKPGQTVVEATSGNTGIALAMVCAAKGYPFVATMVETFSVERRKIMRALGAKVILTPAAERGTGW